MDDAFLAERVTQDLVRAVRDHFVRVHVRGGPAAGLEDVERELSVELPVHDLLASLDDRLAEFAVQEPQLDVRLRARHFDQAKGIDEPPAKPNPANREVLDRPLRLGAPARILGDFQFPEEVFLDAVVRHSHPATRRQGVEVIKVVNGSFASGARRRDPTGGASDRRLAGAAFAGFKPGLDRRRGKRHRRLGRPSSWTCQPLHSGAGALKLSPATMTRYNISTLYLRGPPKSSERKASHAQQHAGRTYGRRGPGLPRMRQRTSRARLRARRACLRFLWPGS